MIPRLCTRKELALVAAIVALACVAAFLSIKLARPRMLSSATPGVEWQCTQSFLITNCCKVVHITQA
jgi:hypothetical protein